MYTRWASSHRLIASHSFWLLYARSRHWDSEFIIKEPSIEGRYVEASTSRTKTSNRRGRRNKATVLVLVCRGLLLRPWAEAWLELRKEILLCATGDQPLLPGVASDGSWSASAVESGAFCTHLRDLLPRHGVPASMLWNIGSHSWNEVIGEGRFLPYESRSGYSREEPEEPNVELVLVPNEDQVDDIAMAYRRRVFLPLDRLRFAIAKIRHKMDGRSSTPLGWQQSRNLRVLNQMIPDCFSRAPSRARLLRFATAKRLATKSAMQMTRPNLASKERQLLAATEQAGSTRIR